MFSGRKWCYQTVRGSHLHAEIRRKSLHSTKTFSREDKSLKGNDLVSPLRLHLSSSFNWISIMTLRQNYRSAMPKCQNDFLLFSSIRCYLKLSWKFKYKKKRKKWNKIKNVVWFVWFKIHKTISRPNSRFRHCKIWLVGPPSNHDTVRHYKIEHPIHLGEGRDSTSMYLPMPSQNFFFFLISRSLMVPVFSSES